MGSYLHDSEKEWKNLSKIFSSRFGSIHAVKTESKNSNMAEAIYNSLEQGSAKRSPSPRKISSESRAPSTTDSKSKRSNFSIRSLLDQDLKSPSDSGYGSGSPSPNESVFTPESPREVHDKLESNFSSKVSLEYNNTEKKLPGNLEKKFLDQGKIFLPPPSLNFPLEYQNLFYAMNARFLQREDCNPKTSNSPFNSSGFPSQFKNSVLNNFADSKDEDKEKIQNFFSSKYHQSQKEKRNLTKQDEAINLCKSPHKETKEPHSKFESSPQPEQLESAKLWRATSEKEVMTSSKRLSPNFSLRPNAESSFQLDYFEQLSRLWLDKAMKSAKNSAIGIQQQPCSTFSPSYLHRLQMFWAASAAASTTARLPFYPPPHFLTQSVQNNAQKYTISTPSSTYPKYTTRHKNEAEMKSELNIF